MKIQRWEEDLLEEWGIKRNLLFKDNRLFYDFYREMNRRIQEAWNIEVRKYFNEYEAILVNTDYKNKSNENKNDLFLKFFITIGSPLLNKIIMDNNTVDEKWKTIDNIKKLTLLYFPYLPDTIWREYRINKTINIKNKYF